MMIATKFEKKQIHNKSAIFAFAVVVVKARLSKTRTLLQAG